MQVYLTNIGNPDFGQDPSRPLPGTEAGLWQPVNSFEQASEACRRYIEVNGLGGGNFCAPAGEVRQMGKCVARVSYNGKVWPPGDWQPGQQPLFVPA